MNERTAAEQGFTLIEVLIAMTLLSLMVTLLFGSMRTCARSWEQGENKMTQVNEQAVVFNFFQRYLAPALPVADETAAAPDNAQRNGTKAAGNRNMLQGFAGVEQQTINTTLSFQGGTESLQFVSVFPASAGRTGMQQFLLYLGRENGEPVLKVALTPYFPTAQGGAWQREEEVLLKGVRHFSLAYFGAVEETGQSSWQAQWLQKNALPRLVRISIATANGAYWPDTIIELKNAAPPAGLALQGHRP
ncbi:MAG: prepilin-type N-terminal cleavage/methylation domain-containing protein [Methylobacter sp.]